MVPNYLRAVSENLHKKPEVVQEKLGEGVWRLGIGVKVGKNCRTWLLSSDSGLPKAIRSWAFEGKVCCWDLVDPIGITTYM